MWERLRPRPQPLCPAQHSVRTRASPRRRRELIFAGAEHETASCLLLGPNGTTDRGGCWPPAVHRKGRHRPITCTAPPRDWFILGTGVIGEQGRRGCAEQLIAAADSAEKLLGLPAHGS